MITSSRSFNQKFYNEALWITDMIDPPKGVCQKMIKNILSLIDKVAGNWVLMRNKNNNGCWNCELHETINLIYWKAAPHPSSCFYPPYNTIIFKEKFKFGEIYQSRCCGSEWYLHNDKYMYLLNPLRKKILSEWGSRDLQVPDQFKPILEIIGSTKFHPAYNNLRHEYPCKIKFKNKSFYEFCILKLSTLPFGFEDAIFGKKKEVYYIDEVENIEVSKYALPEYVRTQTMDPNECSMATYSPIYLQDGNGTAFKVCAFENFTRYEIKHPITFISKDDISYELEHLRCINYPITVINVYADPL